MTSIQEQLKAIKAKLPDSITLIAVSKYHPEEYIAEAYQLGQRHFGENIVQELQRKHVNLPSDIKWHFIGHLQRNKVKYIAPYVHLIHSVDSIELLTEINKQALKSNRIISCLLQIHIAQEETKFGFTLDECRQFLFDGQWKQLENICIEGIMCMASNTPNENQIRAEFHQAWMFYNEIKHLYFPNNEHFRHCSWGMSSDFHLAIEEGSTMVRLGSSIFGQRNHNYNISR